MARVTMPDGTVVEMPDQLDPTLGSRLRAFHDHQVSGGGGAPPASFGNTLRGEGELLGSGIANIPGAAINAVADIGRRIFGGDTSKPGPVPLVHPGEAGRNLVQNVKGMLPSTPNGLDVSDEELRSTDPTGKTPIAQLRAQYQQEGSKPLPQLLHDSGTVVGDVAGNALEVGGDVANIAPAVAAPKALASAGRSVRDAVSGVRSALNGTGFAVEEAGTKPLFNPPDQTPGWARTVAGSSGKDALGRHYQQVGNAASAGEANIPAGTKMSYDATAKGREGPNSVYNRAANSLPEGQFDPTAQAGIKGAGQPEGGRVSKGSPQAQTQIEDLRAQLLDPNRQLTGQQMVNELRGLRQEGFTNVGSEDVSNQQLGRAQLDMARAIEGHIGRNLPANGDVSLEQFQTARKALAKNHAVEAALRGSDVDLNAIARMQRADPELMDGGLKEIAEFANGPGRGLVKLPDQYTQPGKDALEAIDIEHPIKGVTKFLGGHSARKALTGDTAAAVENAVSRFGAQPGRFGPLEPQPPTPGNWTTGEGANPNAPTPQGGPGDIPLADVLSHGVEQSPPQGLTAGPMGAPAPQGMPFRGSPDAVGARVARGGPAPDRTPPRTIMADGQEIPTGLEPEPNVRLGDRLAAPEDSWFKGSADNAGVMSQGVPEGIAARTPPRDGGPLLGDLLDLPGSRPEMDLSHPPGSVYEPLQRLLGDLVEGPTARPKADMAPAPGNAFSPGQRGLFNGGRVIENNDSGSGPASLEAQSRLSQEKAAGTRPVVIDPDGGEAALLHDVTAVDRNPPKGHIIADAKTGKIINSGGMKPSAAQALLNRWKGLRDEGPPLGDLVPES